MDILNELADDVLEINISKMFIEGSLDFSRFTKLQKLDCSWNSITNLDNLPNSLQVLDCRENKISNLDNLQYDFCHIGKKCIMCGSYTTSKQKCINPKPNSLQVLDCSWNNITSLDNLPNSLINLKCSYNFLITNLDNLPNNLIELNCCENEISSLDNLPRTLSDER